ncbi:MAG: hypothetical protein H6686_02245 [Fibrobacteria bacterium]|nr:hypothetical protein [Fibrobacteria bacterium]
MRLPHGRPLRDLGILVLVAWIHAFPKSSPSPAASAWTQELAPLWDTTLPAGPDATLLLGLDPLDEGAVALEATRLRATLPALQQIADSIGSDTLSATRTSDSTRWARLVQGERARLDFLSLGRSDRQARLASYSRRRLVVGKALEIQADSSSAARAEREAERARLALEEGRRKIGREESRLEATRSLLAQARSSLATLDLDSRTRLERTLEWPARLKEARESGAEAVRTVFPSLDLAVDQSRDDLSRLLDTRGRIPLRLPSLGPDPLADLPSSLDATRAQLLRQQAAAERDSVLEEYGRTGRDRIRRLHDEMVLLNQERLATLQALPTGERERFRGLTPQALAEASKEIRHLFLVLRYHRSLAQDWMQRLLTSGTAALPLWDALGVLVPWLLLSLALLWWRRRAPELLDLAISRSQSTDRKSRRLLPGRSRRIAAFFRQIHSPLGWLVFVFGTVRLLPESTSKLLEVEIPVLVLGWILGGSLIVETLDAVSSSRLAPANPSAPLRRRSLRLVGAVVVALGLVLQISERLVGRGTIHGWVGVSCWVASLAVFLILVKWWRETVFARIEQLRRPTPLQAWVLANRAGWPSFLAAMLGAINLFVKGLIKASWLWLASFDLARRIHAWFYRRELDRMAGSASRKIRTPLETPLLESLGPDQPSGKWVSCPGDGLRERLAKVSSTPSTFQMAVVSPRGGGKSRLFAELAKGSSVAVFSPPFGIESLLSALDALPSEEGGPRLVLIDDAHTLIRPVAGGLAEFDRLVDFARDRSDLAWVFALDSSLWPFLQRARDDRPLFDEVVHLEPWDEEEIGALLRQRNLEAGIDPEFDDLLEALPRGADEIDRQEALQARRAGYERMLWDHARGNPGQALEVWRRSLARTSDGDIRVRPLQAPDAVALEALPDTAMFILRAVLQMAPAHPMEVAKATNLPLEQVRQVFRTGTRLGWIEDSQGGARLSWRWLRSFTRILERRHMMGAL